MRIIMQAIRTVDDKPLEVFCLDETGLNEADRLADIADAHTAFPDARVVIHECYHDEGKPCPPVREV